RGKARTAGGGRALPQGRGGVPEERGDPAGLLGGVEQPGGGGDLLPSLGRSDPGLGQGAGERGVPAAVRGAREPGLGVLPEEGAGARGEGAADGAVLEPALLRGAVPAGEGV